MPAAGRARRLAIAVAAAALAVAVVAGFNLGPDWTVLDAGGRGTVVVGVRAVPTLHVAELAKQLKRGGRLRVEDVTLMLAAGDALMLEIPAGTELELSPAPGRWWSREARIRLVRGTLRLGTGRGFPGAALAITAPGATIATRGGVMAVTGDDAGGRVDVLDGAAAIVGGPEVAAGRRYRFAATATEALDDSTAAALTALRARLGAAR